MNKLTRGKDLFLNRRGSTFSPQGQVNSSDPEPSTLKRMKLERAREALNNPDFSEDPIEDAVQQMAPRTSHQGYRPAAENPAGSVEAGRFMHEHDRPTTFLSSNRNF